MQQATIPAAEFRRLMGLNPPIATSGQPGSSMGKARGKLPKPGRTYESGKMNNTEAAYSQLLDRKKAAGEVLCWHFEEIKLKLADKTFYTVDFFVVVADGTLEAHEVKGHWEDDARVKIKVAAEQFPWLQFIAVKIVKGAWDYERF